MKKLATISVSILCALSLVHFSSAQDKGGKGGDKGKGGGSAEDRAAMMMEQGDKDGDGKLSMDELVALLESGKAGGKGGKGKGGKGGDKGGKGGKGGDSDDDQGGGQAPKRPEVE